MKRKKPIFDKLMLTWMGCSILCSSVAYTADYSFHPDINPHLGGGFDPKDPNFPFEDCLIKQDPKIVEQPLTDIEIKAVHSETEIQTALETSAQISGSLLFMKGKATTQFGFKDSFEEDSVTYIILAKTTYGKEYLPKHTLDPALENAKVEELKEWCGPEIVVQQKKGVMLLGVFTWSSISREQKKFLSANLGIKGGNVVATGQVKAGLEKIATDFRLASHLNLKIRAIGGGGISEVRDLVKNGASAIAEAPKLMSEYLKTMTYAHSAPIFFSTKTIEQIKKIPADTSMLSLNTTRLYYDYKLVDNTLSKLDRILKEGDPSFEDISAEHRAKLIGYRTKYSTISDKLLQEAKRCLGGADLCRARLDDLTMEINIREIPWPAKKPNLEDQFDQEEQKRRKEQEEMRYIAERKAACDVEALEVYKKEYEDARNIQPRAKRHDEKKKIWHSQTKIRDRAFAKCMSRYVPRANL